MIKNLPTGGDGLPTDFETKKHKYRVMRPGDPLGITRFSEYEKLQIAFGFGQSFAGILDVYGQIERLLGADKPFAEIRTEAILLVNSAKRSIVDMSAARYNKALYLATLFIVREGDDATKWDMHTAESYIQDWAEEGLSEQDFFMLSASAVRGFKETFNKIKGEVSREEERLSAITTSRLG